VFFTARETGKPRRPSAPADLPFLWGMLDSAPGLLALSPLLLPHLRVMRGRKRGRSLIGPHCPLAAGPLCTEFPQQRGQVLDLLTGKELQSHDLQAAVHPQLIEPLSVRVVGRDDFPFELFGNSLPNPFRRSALN